MSKVLDIYIAERANAVMVKKEHVFAEAGKGLVGDRYYQETGTFSDKLAGLPDKEITLIEAEEIDQFNEDNNFHIPYGDFRRNIITHGLSLNDLVGKEFSIGGVLLKGIRLCEPCAHLSKVLVPEVLPDLVGKAGLRAQILRAGNIRANDFIAV